MADNARRQRLRWQVIGGIAAAVVAVGIVLAVVLLRGSGKPTATSTATGSPSASPTSPTPSATMTPSSSPGSPSASAATVGPPGGPVPGGFAPLSVTFISASKGWVVGSAPCGRPPCTSLVRTRDGGATWQGVPAPVIPLAMDGAQPVAILRFADASNGWLAAGAQLQATHDGGVHWSAVTLPGLQPSGRIDSLETSAGTVDAWVVQSMSSSGAEPATLYYAAVGADAWTTVSSVSSASGAGGAISLAGRTGWVLVGDHQVFRTTDASTWQATPSPCPNQTSTAIAIADASTLYAACTGQGSAGGAMVDRTMVVSHDGGATFHASPNPPQTGDYGGMAATPDGRTLALAVTSAGGASIQLSRDGGSTYSTPYSVNESQSGGLVDIGFTTGTQGVAIAEGQQDSLLMTSDGGATWRAVPF
jgi:hypothetical protein